MKFTVSVVAASLAAGAMAVPAPYMHNHLSKKYVNPKGDFTAAKRQLNIPGLDALTGGAGKFLVLLMFTIVSPLVSDSKKNPLLHL